MKILDFFRDFTRIFNKIQNITKKGFLNLENSQSLTPISHIDQHFF